MSGMRVCFQWERRYVLLVSSRCAFIIVDIKTGMEPSNDDETIQYDDLQSEGGRALGQ